jgi:hypothetical protein
MSEAIWLAGSALPKSSRESPQAWVKRFLAESRVKPEWITSIHLINSKPGMQPSTWEFPVIPQFWSGGTGQAHFILSATSREVRAGDHDLVMLLEINSAGWNASLLASPAFFGPRNRIPAVVLLETRTFNQTNPEQIFSRQKKYLDQFNLPFDPIPDFSTAWLKNTVWVSASGLLNALNAAASSLVGQPGRKSAILTSLKLEPGMVTILEGL